MKPLAALFIHPTKLVTAGITIPMTVIHILTAVYLVIGSLSFQYIYPRLLDKIPMLGHIRKLALWKETPLFSPKLYLYGLLLCLVILVLVLAVYAVAAGLKDRSVDLKKTYISGVVTIMPFLAGLILGMVLFPIHYYFGLVPVVGLLILCCLQGGLLRECHGIGFTLSCYLIPVLMGIQFYAVYLVRP